MNDKLRSPYNLDAEKALLGAVLMDGTVYDELTLQPSDFYHEPHRFVYQAYVSLITSRTGINQITVAEELNRIDKLDYCGGVAYLENLMASCPSPLDAVFYAGIVKRLSIARQLVVVGEDIKNIGFSSPTDTTKALSECDDKLLNVRKSGVVMPIISPKERADSLLARYTELHTKEMVMAIRTGLYDLDYLLGGGFYNGDVVIVGASTSMGKTTFLSFLAKEIAVTRNVLFASAEMNCDSLSDREVAQVIGVPTNRIRLGNYEPLMFTKIIEAVSEISERQVYLYDDTPMTTDKILQQALSMQARHGLGAVIIDYLGMLDDTFGRSPYERYSYISRKIKHMARKLDVPVIVAHQLSREHEKREDKRPYLHDLRDSGSIEADADDVLFLYRDNYYNREVNPDDENITEIIVAKQRQGDNGIVRVKYDRAKQRYLNLVREELQ